MATTLVWESVGWDAANWSRALAFWEQRTELRATGLKALEVGAGGAHGNLSLWLAAKGFAVVCSGTEAPSDALRRCHAAHGVEDRIAYEAIDVLDIPYTASFDVIVFKSLLGVFGMRGGDAVGLQRAAVGNIWRALRNGGELWFAEGARGSRLHAHLRSRFGWGRHGWRYVGLDEIGALLSPFDGTDIRAFGVLGLLGRSEVQRRALGTMDRLVLERLVAEHSRYIVAGVARKGGAELDE
ncbi:class I SAM-dependent methyltransferase [Streptomyces justiciae]|uniref:class I SAM-dependent methyltransferase n=1 Tax=Streptomyces justiciae TaxID=2780140 RepID=UPI00188056EF|nr:class I SAM-dependent methyltransferase [Streptomyces justiciae]MBE8474522.1 class I SAM-dependent methyltransferase [Streptomyces justiciae]MCW8378915.1 class I SAM-dependent methyltransferase [Streptomyces justiciae]